ncbi:MAG: YqgE/AlgH family protein, partial [Simkania sp.]|nr:YqgE/AlgH family protein [Simkania sp.]
MQKIPYSELKKGSFLIASPEVNDGLFFRSVVLLCDQSPVGSFGIIINKSLDMDVPEEMLNLGELADANISIRAGGPNQPNQIML